MKLKLRISKSLLLLGVLLGMALALPPFSLADSICIDNVSSGTTVSDTASSLTISHTTGSGTYRLMLVGISYNNDNYETVTGVTYNSVSLTKVGEINNSDDAMMYIYRLVAPDVGTHNVVINFSTNLTQGAVAGVVTFTGVHQTTPLGTFASAQGDDSTQATVGISSAAGELVFGVASAEYDAFTTASSGQDEHWNHTVSGESTNGVGGTDNGATTVTMTWDLNADATPDNHWAIGGVSIKPAGGKNLVMVVGTDSPSSSYDSVKQTLFESWGWTVSTINDTDSQIIFNNAAANNDVMYISESSTSSNVSTKARDLDIGIVDDECWLWDAMEYGSTGDGDGDWGTTINITNNSHYITSPFSTGSLTVYTASGDLNNLPSSVASGGQLLGQTPNGGDPTLFAFDTGATLDSGTAANRRVGFPSFDSHPDNWSANLETLLQRSLDWAAGFADGGVVNPCGTNLVMVTGDGTTTTDADDAAKKALFESWGWTVTAIEDQYGDYSGAASSNDVMFISESAESSAIGTQATNLNIGIMVEERAVMDEMELYSSQNYTSGTGTQIDIVDNTHYIASTLSTGAVTIYSSTDSLIIDQATPAPGAIVVAEEVGGNNTALIAVPTGATLDNGAGAANRRVGFIAMHESTPGNWTSSMETLVQRSLEWAAGCGADGGGTNSAPVLNTIGDKSVTVDELLEFTISANDADGDTLTYSSPNLPSGATLDANTGEFSWTPTALDVGEYNDVEFIVTDNGDPQKSDSEKITITVYGAAPPPDVGGYSCYMKITIHSEQVAGDLEYFPVLIHITDEESLKTSGCGFMTDPAGDDLIFTNAAKSLQLDHEIEKYDGNTGELVAWVKIPFLSGSTDTEIYMYYGNSGVTSPQENPTEVWDSNYVGVWHLKESGNGTADEFVDSSGTNHGRGGAGTSYRVPSRYAGGKIGYAQSFDGSNDYIQVDDSASLHISDYLTVEAWIWPDERYIWQTIVSKMYSQTEHLYFVLDDNSSSLYLGLNGVRTDWDTEDNVSTYGWHHVAFAYNGSNTRVYLDGSQVAYSGYSGTLTLGSNTHSFYIGYNEGWTNEVWNGKMDEVRISNAARSAQWIQTSYNNQNSPYPDFYDYDIQCPTQAQPEDFSCSMEFTINNTMVSGSSDLADFPVLIRLTDDALKNTSTCGFVTNSNGYDILFTDSNDNQLDHEIAKYDGTTGELIAWVKKTISPAPDDPQNIIRMYYGNSNVCGALENPTAVWDSNYEVVLHLQESGNGTSDEFKDSTSNGHHGTGGGLAGAGSSYRTPSRATGKFGYAQDFDGGNDLIRLNGVNDGSWTAVTVQAWINPDDTNDDRLFGKCWGTGSDDETWLLRKPSGGNFGVRMRTDTNYNGGYDPGSLSIGSWQHVAATWTASDNQLRVFKDGVQQGATTLNGSHLFSNSSGETGYPDADYVDQPTLGNTPGNDRDYDGKMQEARVSRIARSADWLLTEYNNQNDPSSFAPVTNNTCSIPEPNPADFRCWRPITIDKDYVMGSTDLVNFPLLIKINSDPLLEHSNPPTDCGKVEHPDGYDIIFTDENGTELLDHEIETYESGTGKLVAWVRIPQLSTYSDTVIRMYYGNANIGCPTENPTGVWDSNYMGVWHLSDTSGDTQDSTSYATSGSLSGSGVSRGSWSNIYNSFRFSDSGELDWGNPSHLNAGTQSWTVSLWANIDYNRGDGAWEKIINKGKGEYEPGYEMELDDYNNNLYFAINDGSTQWGPSTGTSFTTDTWTYFVGVVDRATQYIRLYRNGDQKGSNYIGAYGSIDVSDSLTIGKDNWGWPAARIEEVRVSNTARSADWIKTEWYNQNGSVAFYTLGDDSCESEYKYQYCKKITVDHNKVSGSSHDNFPLLVKLTTDDLKWVTNGGLVENEFGYDIAFKDENCNMLDYEIESYDKDAGTLVAWVRVPTLSGSTDTEIYMYYGNPFIECPSDNATDVWNSYYEAVYHFNDDFQDSTGQHNGTNHGATFTTGKIGNGALFDPTDGYDYIDIGDWSVDGDDLTIQAWVYPENFSQNDPRIISKCDDDSASEDNHIFMLSLYDGNNGENRLRFRIRGTYDDSYNECVGGCDPAACEAEGCYWDTVWYTVRDTVTLYGSDPNGYLPTAQAWYFVAGTYEDDHSTEMQLYRDDGLNAGGRDHNGNLVTYSWDVWIGANPYGTDNSTYSWHGVIDEVRVLSMDLSQDWLRTEYNNINDPESFYSLSSCTKAITPVTSEWREEF